MLTKYPLGVAKVLPFTVHSAGDYLAAALLIVSPFALNFNNSDTGLTAFYIVAGIAVLAVSLVTNYQYSDKRGVGRRQRRRLTHRFPHTERGRAPRVLSLVRVVSPSTR